MALTDLRNLIKDTPISNIIGNFIPLTRRGNQTLGICPFHNDTKPSLNVKDKLGMFMCFFCQTGGDAATVSALSAATTEADTKIRTQRVADEAVLLRGGRN